MFLFNSKNCNSHIQGSLHPIQSSNKAGYVALGSYQDTPWTLKMKLPEAPLPTFSPISSSIHCQWSRGELANFHCHQNCSHASFQWNVCKSNDQPSSSPSSMVTGHWQPNVRSAICRFHSSVKFMLPFQFSCQILLTAAHWDKYRYRLENKYLISFGTLSLVFN